MISSSSSSTGTPASASESPPSPTSPNLLHGKVHGRGGESSETKAELDAVAECSPVSRRCHFSHAEWHRQQNCCDLGGEAEANAEESPTKDGNGHVDSGAAGRHAGDVGEAAEDHGRAAAAASRDPRRRSAEVSRPEM
ncbi:Os05g0169801 [Oryza sativa Japonica Group]|uniref:Os05g0169801 protein n=1 Tax=Oryza sativa subsp. japonica TaxID=39947 RepID=A0A0P0WIF2_ORYSJ|nr:Os05g0169801 [Oryza sativa Japonica Group]